MTVRILTVVGARPQFVKAAVVSSALAATGRAVEVLVHTGQHFDDNMSRIFFDELELRKADHNLGIGGGSHGANTGRMIEALEQVMLDEKPDWVMVYGDTDSTLAGAVAASKLCIPIAHVEAGLRSFNRAMPEEINRILTDHASQLLLCPSGTAVDNLAREGLSGNKVRNVGDVMYDAVLHFTGVAERKSDVLARVGVAPKQYVLTTLHRKENVDDPERLPAILRGLASAPGQVVLPLHPRTRKRIAEFGVEFPNNVLVIDPVGYLDMMLLERHASAIATDSGGVQKEAYFHGVPCAVLRDETEWVELVEIGANRLVRADPEAIAQAIGEAQPTIHVENIYGDGKASVKVAELLLQGN